MPSKSPSTVGAGAFIQQEYVKRNKKVVAVDMSDLKGILEIDGWENTLSVSGQFLFVGAFWLGLETFIESGLTDGTRPTLAVCLIAGFGGGVLFYISRRMRKLKRDRIEEIITETGDAI